jgi:hypothetical protein
MRTSPAAPLLEPDSGVPYGSDMTQSQGVPHEQRSEDVASRQHEARSGGVLVIFAAPDTQASRTVAWMSGLLGRSEQRKGLATCPTFLLGWAPCQC